MSIESHDPWLSPSRQAEFPSRLVLSATKLHRRREKTFLFLVAMVLLSAVALPLFGTRLVVDVRHTVETVVQGVAMPDAELAFGVFVVPLGLFGIALVTELYGRRRAYAAAIAGLLAGLAAIGLVYASEQVEQAGLDVSAAVALVIAQFVAHLAVVPVLGNMRERAPTRRYAVRYLVATLVALLAAWTVFAFVLYAQAVQLYGYAEDAVIADIGRLVLGGALYCVAVTVVAVVPYWALARGLGVYLRVGRFEEDDEEDEDFASARSPVVARKPQALVVDTPPPMRRELRHDSRRDRRDSRRDKKTSIPPFSSTEMRFFTEGDELAEPAADAPVDGKQQRA